MRERVRFNGNRAAAFHFLELLPRHVAGINARERGDNKNRRPKVVLLEYRVSVGVVVDIAVVESYQHGFGRQINFAVEPRIKFVGRYRNATAVRQKFHLRVEVVDFNGKGIVAVVDLVIVEH